MRFYPTENGEIVENDEPPVEYLKPYKNPPDVLHPFTRFRMDSVQAQDHMAWKNSGDLFATGLRSGWPARTAV